MVGFEDERYVFIRSEKFPQEGFAERLGHPETSNRKVRVRKKLGKHPGKQT